MYTEEDDAKFNEVLRPLSSISDRMGRSEDRLVQSEQAMQAIMAGHVGSVSQLSGHMDADDSGQDVKGLRARAMDFLVTGETADCVSPRSEHIERSMLTVTSAPPAYMERTTDMETIYEAGGDGEKIMLLRNPKRRCTDMMPLTRVLRR